MFQVFTRKTILLQFSCCGAGKFEDWRASEWRKQNPNMNLTTPDSCCRTPSEYCAVRSHPSNIYYDVSITFNFLYKPFIGV